MTLRCRMIGLILGTLAVTAGCGPTCESACSEAGECDGGGEGDVTECTNDCEETRTLAEAEGCEAEFDDLLGCFAEDVCNADCEAEFTVLAAKRRVASA